MKQRIDLEEHPDVVPYGEDYCGPGGYLTIGAALLDQELFGGYLIVGPRESGRLTYFLLKVLDHGHVEQYRSVEAYGRDLLIVTEDEWAAAGWNELRLEGVSA